MRKNVLFPVCIALGLILVCLTASAQTPTKKEVLAGQLLDELNMQKMFDSAFDAVPKMQEQMLASKESGMSAEARERFHKKMQTAMQATKQAMDWNSMKGIFVKIYADNFEEADLQGMIDFYKSPVGQKWVQKQPQIQAATMQAMAGIMPKIQAAVMKSFSEDDDQPTKP